jgi:Clp amino terminal domain, pathogenicity island component
MIRQMVEKRAAKAKDQRFGPEYNFGATYFDARDEAVRRGDRSIGTEHLVLALLVDPLSPAARAIGRDIGAARSALDALDREALSAIGVEPGIATGTVAVRTHGKLRLTPAAKSIFTKIPDARRNRAAGLGKVFNALLDLRRPDPAAELLALLGVDVPEAREKFTQFDQAARDQRQH